MPGRWVDGFRVDPELDIEDFYTVPGSTGMTIAEHCGAAIAQIDVLALAIRTTLYTSPDPLDDQVVAAVSNAGTGPWPKTAREALNKVSSSLKQLREELELINTSGWNRSATSHLEMQSFTVLTLARGSSRVAAERLIAVESLVRELT